MLNRTFARYGSALVASAFGVGAAQAGVTGTIEIVAHSGGMTSDPIIWTIDEDDLADDGHTSRDYTDPIQFVANDGSGQWMATMNPDTFDPALFNDPDFDPSVYQHSGYTFMQDPVVNLNFAVQANPAFDTTFTITSALLNFPPIAGATGQASAAFSVTDGNISGSATLTGAVAGLPGGGGESGAYIAQYNGLAAMRTGTTFADLHQAPVVAIGLGATQSDTDSILSTGIGGLVSSMSSALRFTVSAGDLASGTTTFEVVPEPASLALLAAGLAFVRRR